MGPLFPAAEYAMECELACGPGFDRVRQTDFLISVPGGTQRHVNEENNRLRTLVSV